MAHEVDANTIALWRLNEPETRKEYSTAKDDRGWQGLAQTTSGDAPGIAGGPSGTDISTRFSRWNDTSDYFEAGSQDLERLRRVLLGPHTIEAWVNPEAIGANQDLFTWGAVGETVDTNYLQRFRINTSGRLESFWENNAGVNGAAGQNVGATVPALAWTHVAMVVDVPDRYELSYAFDGTNEYFDIGDVSELSFTFSDPFSVSAWVRKTGASFGMIIGKVNSSTDSPALRGWQVDIDANGSFEIYLREDGATGIAVRTTAQIFDDGNWHHVVFTYDGSNTIGGLTIYVNDSVEALTTVLNSPGMLLTNTASVLIGARNTTALEGPFTGNISDVSVWDKELSAAEVTELFGRDHPIDASTSSMSANLVGWWRMGNEPLGTIHRDALVFGGTDEFVTMGNVSELDFERTDAFSASIWVKATLGSEGVLLGKIGSQGWYVTMPADGRIWFILRNTGGGANEIAVHTTPLGFDDGNWHHVVATYDGSSTAAGVTIYVDNVSISLTIVANTLNATTLTTAEFKLGTTNSGSFPLVGSLADAAVYSKELTAGEVDAIYGNRNPPDLTSVGPTANLVGYWPLQASPSAPISTVSTAFGGTDEYATLGVEEDLNFGRGQVFSASMWVKLGVTANSADQLLGNLDFGTSKGWGVVMDGGGIGVGTGFPVFLFGDGINTLVVGASTRIDDNTWHHLAFSYDGSSSSAGVRFYLDGVDVTTDFIPATLTGGTSSPSSFDLARFFGVLFMVGSLDEVSIYTSVLSAADVARIYNGGYPVDLLVDSTSSSLLAWWRMGDGDTFPTLRDSSGNRYHATMINMESGDLATNAPGQFPTVYDESASGNDGVMTNMEVTDISRYSGVTQQLFPDVPDESPSANRARAINMEAADLQIDNSIPLCDIHWHINGVLEDSDTDVLWAEGGSSGSYYVFSELNGATPLVGRCFEMRISNVARTTPEILANAQATNFEHPLDADTEVLWRFNELPEVLDVSGNGYHLGPENFDTAAANDLPAINRPLIGDGGLSRMFFGNRNDGDTGYWSPVSSDLQAFFAGAAESTVELWFLWGDRKQDGYLITLGAVGESSPTNFLMGMSIDAAGRFLSFWESGAGVNQAALTTNPLVDPSDPEDFNYPHHVALVKRSVGGGSSEVDFYKDGQFVETIGPLTDPFDGSAGVLALGINAGNVVDSWDGTLDDVRLSSVARTASEILASYEAGVVDTTGEATTEYFKMRGIDQTCPTQPAYVYWVVQDEPDSTASLLDPGDLPCGSDPSTDVIDIEIAMTWRE